MTPAKESLPLTTNLHEIKRRHRETQEYYEQLKQDSGEPLRATGPQVHQDRAELIEMLNSALSTLSAESARVKELEAELAAIRGVQFSPTGDNHHNAWLCPHCNPGTESPLSLTKRIEAESARADRAEERVKWQPIESAPKDGSVVLLSGNGIHGVGWMQNGSPVAGTGSRAYRKVTWTHWMPLPHPAALRDQEGATCKELLQVRDIPGVSKE